jgi:flagellar protein FlaJ
VKLISEAQEASSQIQDVLSTAAQASENQDDIDRERKSRTRMQVVIIIMTYLTLLGVIALLKVQFLDTMQGLGSATSGGGGAAQTDKFSTESLGPLSMLFFHAVTLQAILSSFIAGYIRDVNLISGVKFAVILSTIALVVWIAVGGGDTSAAGADEAAEAALMLLLVGPVRGDYRRFRSWVKNKWAFRTS